MKIVQVTYTVKPEFAAQNSANIQIVMDQLRELNPPGINYSACLGSNGKTFIHTAFFETVGDQELLNELPSFKYFQEQLKASGPEIPPKPEALTLVASSKNIF